MSQNINENKVMEKGATNEGAKEFLSLEDLLSEEMEVQKGEVEATLINGKKVLLPITGLLADQEKDIRKTATRRIQGPKGVTEEIDDFKYNVGVISAATDYERTTLRWNDAELARKLKVPVANAEFTIPKILSIGGIASLVNKILEFSGLGQKTFEEKVEEVKN